MKQTPRTVMRNPRTPRVQPAENRRDAVDAVKVFCRVRPLQLEMYLTSLRVKNFTTICLSPQDQPLQHHKQRNAPLREVQYKFQHVFNCDATQRDVFTAVAQPLVENLIRGRDSLLFTYGVTDSGKTYTMTGNLKDRGILPQCLDALFRTISDYQAEKFVFKPDRLNGFEILSEEDALLERQKEITNMRSVTSGRRTFYSQNLIKSSVELAPLTGFDRDNMYSVFITYVEIFNNSVYDLLDGQKTMQSKIIREDARRHMFVHSVTEVEAKTLQEAFEVFQLGQKRKHMGHTALNSESSRSHSVFNIRLVQAPKENHRQTVSISQLSLVDLAGSERTSRTKNTGARLREAGNINNSLMTLRTCLEYLRENQQMTNGMDVPKKIPYRDSKITHMFKSYFDGEGQVSMIVCINPRMEDYDENLQVLKFAEMTQELQIPRATPIKTNVGSVEVNKLYKVTQGIRFKSLGPELPKYDPNSLETTIQIQKIRSCLELRLANRQKLADALHFTMNKLQQILLESDKDNLQIPTDVTPLIGVDKQKHSRSDALENKENMTHQPRSQSSENLLSVKTYVPATHTDIYATPRREVAPLNLRYRQYPGNPNPLGTHKHTYLHRPKSVMKLTKVGSRILNEADINKNENMKLTLIDADKQEASYSTTLKNKENISKLQRCQSSENLLSTKYSGKAYMPASKTDIYATPRRGATALRLKYFQTPGNPIPMQTHLNRPKPVIKLKEVGIPIPEKADNVNNANTKLSLIGADIEDAPRSTTLENKENITNLQRSQSFENLLTFENRERGCVAATQTDIYATPRRGASGLLLRYCQAPINPIPLATFMHSYLNRPKSVMKLTEELLRHGTIENAPISKPADKDNDTDTKENVCSTCGRSVQNKEVS